MTCELTPNALAAADLLRQGYAFLPIAETGFSDDPRAVMQSAGHFFDRRIEAGDAERWRANRPGENERDVGLLHVTSAERNHTGEKKDDKIHWMHTRDTLPLLRNQNGLDPGGDSYDARFLDRMSHIHECGLATGRQVLGALDRQMGTRLTAAYDYTHQESDVCSPYAASATRVMRYFKE